MIICTIRIEGPTGTQRDVTVLDALAALFEVRDILTDSQFNPQRCQDAVRTIDKVLKP